jgi:hypothetical protein
MIKHDETPQGLPPMEIEGNDDEESQAMSTSDDDDDEDYDERQSLVDTISKLEARNELSVRLYVYVLN